MPPGLVNPSSSPLLTMGLMLDSIVKYSQAGCTFCLEYYLQLSLETLSDNLLFRVIFHAQKSTLGLPTSLTYETCLQGMHDEMQFYTCWISQLVFQMSFRDVFLPH